MAIQFTTHITNLNDTDDQSYLNGGTTLRWAANTPAKVAPVNAFLHETTLVVTALMSYVNAITSESYAPTSPEADIKTGIENAIKKTKVDVASKAEHALTYEINGTTSHQYDGSADRSFAIYAPTTAGARYQVVVSYGGGQPLVYSKVRIEETTIDSNAYSVITSSNDYIAIGTSNATKKLKLFDTLDMSTVNGAASQNGAPIRVGGGIFLGNNLQNASDNALNVNNNAYISKDGKINVQYVTAQHDIKTPTGTITAQTFVATSDIRKKEDIKDYKPSKSILDLPIKQFDFKSDKSHHIGCIAQDLQLIAPELVHEDEEGYLQIEESKLIYLLIDEVKMLRAEIDELKRSK